MVHDVDVAYLLRAAAADAASATAQADVSSIVAALETTFTLICTADTVVAFLVKVAAARTGTKFAAPSETRCAAGVVRGVHLSSCKEEISGN